MARFLGFILFFLLLSLASSTYISDTIFEPHRSTGRSLLQNKKNCPVNFENQNYTIITSKCKGPKYTADLCCGAFKDFACPFAEQINDMSTNCADTMFSYINLYGKYPPGILPICAKGINMVSHVTTSNQKTWSRRIPKQTVPILEMFCPLWWQSWLALWFSWFSCFEGQDDYHNYRSNSMFILSDTFSGQSGPDQCHGNFGLYAILFWVPCSSD